jgi:GAF domain-containing protein
MTTPSTPGDPSGVPPELFTLLMSTRSVEEVMSGIAGLAAGITRLPSSCGITLRRDHQPLTVASSDAFALAVDEVQYGIDQGPCLEAMSTGCVITVPDLTLERRWSNYPSQAIAFGVRSSLSLPLYAEGDPLGALNLYARRTHAFSEPTDVAAATAMAAQGSAVLVVVLHKAQQVELTAQLREALVSRSVIDQAIGIIMAQQRCSDTQAFGILRSASQNRNRKLHDIATDIVTSVGGQPPEPAHFRDPRMN